MSKVEIAKDLIKKIFPYLLIIAVSFLSNAVYFNFSLAKGDDVAFHLSMTNDVIYGLKHGYFLMSANHLHMGGFALNNYGFYGPLTHFNAAIFTIMFEWAGATPTFGLKAVVVLSAIFGGIYVYFLGMKMSKGNRIISSIAAVLFVFLPYRVFCALCRCAFAESVAICFIPAVFYGAYSILNDKEYSVHAYVALCVGAIGVILSHAFTGMITGIFGFVYLIFNIKKLIAKRDGFSIWPSFAIAAFVCCCGVGFYIGNAFYYKSTDLYNLCDPIRQWTNYEHVSKSTLNSNDFSGFLNLIVINSWQGTERWNSETVSSITFSIGVYFISMVLAVICDVLLRKVPHNKYFRYPCVAITAFILPLITLTREEVWISVGVSTALLLFILFIFDYVKPKEENNKQTLLRNPDFYFCIFALCCCFVLLYVPTAWQFVPEILYQCQFAWRLWGVTTFFFVMLVLVILTNVKISKNVLISASILACSLVSLSMGAIEKRVAYNLNPDNVVQVDGYDYAIDTKFSGAQNEMIPQIYYDSSYTPENPNSLYYAIRYKVWYWRNYFYSIEDYPTPAILEGDGTVQIIEYNSPENTFHCEITSETALVQLPQFYYAGYYAYVDGNCVAEGTNVDGLVTFKLPKGSYDVKIRFKESKAVEIGMPFFFVGMATLVGGGVFGYFYRTKILPKKKAKKEQISSN